MIQVIHKLTSLSSIGSTGPQVIAGIFRENNYPVICHNCIFLYSLLGDKVDADYSEDTVAHRSIPILLVYLNSVPIYWSFNKNNSLDSISFGSEFVAMKQ